MLAAGKLNLYWEVRSWDEKWSEDMTKRQHYIVYRIQLRWHESEILSFKMIVSMIWDRLYQFFLLNFFAILNYLKTNLQII